MIVIVAERIPAKLRGVLKMWFLEPKPNVFVSSVKGNVAEEVSKLVSSNLSDKSGFLIVSDDSKSSDGLSIKTLGFVDKKVSMDLGIHSISRYLKST